MCQHCTHIYMSLSYVLIMGIVYMKDNKEKDNLSERIEQKEIHYKHFLNTYETINGEFKRRQIDTCFEGVDDVSVWFYTDYISYNGPQSTRDFILYFIKSFIFSTIFTIPKVSRRQYSRRALRSLSISTGSSDSCILK